MDNQVTIRYLNSITERAADGLGHEACSSLSEGAAWKAGVSLGVAHGEEKASAIRLRPAYQLGIPWNITQLMMYACTVTKVVE